jgi:hypothetical protein
MTADKRSTTADIVAQIAALPDAAVNASEDSPQPDTAAAAPETPSASPEPATTVPEGPDAETLVLAVPTSDAQWKQLEQRYQGPPEKLAAYRRVIEAVGNVWDGRKIQEAIDYGGAVYGLTADQVKKQLLAESDPDVLIGHFRAAAHWAKTQRPAETAKRPSERPARHQPRVAEVRAATEKLERTGRPRDARAAVAALLGDKMSTD